MIELIEDTSSSFRILKIKNPKEKLTSYSDRSFQIIDEPVLSDVNSTIERPKLYNQSVAYPCVSFGLSQSIRYSNV
jgi:hypothetical protein